MKKIFYILPVLFSFIMASCDDEATIVHLNNETVALNVSGISPKRGYQGTVVTLIGSNFGVSKEFVKVFFGNSEQMAEVISCVDGQIVVKVPEGAISGAITLEILNQKLTTSDVVFSVVPDPEITELSSGSVYSGDEITISGKNFGTVAEEVKLYGELNGEEVLFAVSSCENEEIKAVIPVTSVYGEFDVKMEIAGRVAISSQKITILEKATITAIKSDSKLFNGKFAFAGDKVTITGSAFGTNPADISVKFGDLDASSIESCDNDKIVAIVPTGFTGGKVTVIKDGISSTSDDELKVLADGTDISDGALVDARNPQSITLTPGQAGTNATIGVPANWEYTPNMLNRKNTNGTEYVGLVKINAEDANNFTIGAGWGRDPEPSDETTPSDNYIKNGKMYQKTSLPGGSYTLKMEVMGHGNSGSQLHYVVSKASGAFPNFNNITGNDLVIASLSENLRTDARDAYTVELDFTLTEETDVYIGLALNFVKNIWYDFKGFNLIYNHGN